MSDSQKPTDFIRALAGQLGLQRALEKFPEGVTAAAERGLRPVGAAPAGNAPLAQPASIFNPEPFERRK